MIIELIATASVTCVVTSAFWMHREFRLGDGHETERPAFLDRLTIWEEKDRRTSENVQDLSVVLFRVRDELEALRPDAEKWRAKKERDRAYDERRRAKPKPCEPKAIKWDEPIWDALGRECEVRNGPDNKGDVRIGLKGTGPGLWFTYVGEIEGGFDNSDFHDDRPRARLTNTPPLEKNHD
jgi:hypothetical protein